MPHSIGIIQCSKHYLMQSKCVVWHLFQEHFPNSQEKCHQYPSKKNCQARIGFGSKYRATSSCYVWLFDRIYKFCFYCQIQILRPNSYATFYVTQHTRKHKNSHNDSRMLFALPCYMCLYNEHNPHMLLQNMAENML